jgi:DNA modification methylase
MNLFGAILSVYSSKPTVSNDDLYASLQESGVVSAEEINTRVPIGIKGEMHSLGRRKVRWYQQTLKKLGLIEKVGGSRGAWRSTTGQDQDPKDNGLTAAPAGVALVAFSTKLGVAIWGDCRHVFSSLSEPIHLCITSPPYCLAQPRAYGNPSQAEYVDFICEALEPIVKNLVPGGSICLNVSNDIFVPGSPARSLVRERMVIALHDRLGLHKMDELIWLNPSKAPGPIAWASKKRVQLNVAYEPVYWFTNDPHQVRSDNRRVLQPHSDRHLKLIAAGGEKRESSFGDGANKVKVGSFGAPTAGRIPRNVITSGHRCAHQTPARALAKSAGLPVHGAAMPFAVADFLVKFLTVPGDHVVEPFSGLGTTPEAAEANGCRWTATDIHHEYLYCSSPRFSAMDEFELELSL